MLLCRHQLCLTKRQLSISRAPIRAGPLFTGEAFIFTLNRVSDEFHNHIRHDLEHRFANTAKTLARKMLKDSQPQPDMGNSVSRRQTSQYPEPVVVQPSSGQHQESFIVLHGRGSNGEMFGAQLLLTPIPDFDDLQAAFPHAKFIFPTASKRRAQVLNRTPMNQWFDIWSLKSQTDREELQFDGLRESSEHIHGLLHAEIAAVGAENVVLWGLSQGCALSLTTTLLWEGPKFAAVVGMCGWLPLRKRMEYAVQFSDAPDDEENPFSESGRETSDETTPVDASPKSNVDKAIQYLHEELQLPSERQSSKVLEIPVFLGHGTEDEKVPVTLGKDASSMLCVLGFDVEYREYNNLAHWYSGTMLRDIVWFVQQNARFGQVSDTTHPTESKDK